jgi:hypothetical protein
LPIVWHFAFFGAGSRVDDLEFFARRNVITQPARGPS